MNLVRSIGSLACSVFALLYVQTFAFAAEQLPSGFTPEVVVVLGDAPEAHWFHSGALEALENYAVPVDVVVGAGEGAPAAVLWCAGIPARQISDLMSSPRWTEAWSDPPERERPWLPVADSGDPHLALDLTLLRRDSGLALERVDGISVDLRGASLQVLLADALAKAPEEHRCRAVVAWSSPEGRAIPAPFKDEAHAAVVSTGMDQVLGDVHGASRGAALPQGPGFPRGGYLTLGIVPVPLRPSTSAEDGMSRYLSMQVERSLAANPDMVVARPVVLKPDSAASPAYLWAQGFLSIRARLGDISSHLPSRTLSVQAAVENRQAIDLGLSPSVGKDSVYSLILDSVPSEVQDHLRSFLKTADGLGSDKLLRAMQDAAASGMYSQVSLVPDNGDIRVRAVPRNRLELGLGGFGDIDWGPHALASLRFRFLDQSEYRLQVQTFAGAHAWGLQPSFQMIRMQGGSFGVAVLGDIGEYDLEGAGLVPDVPATSALYREERRFTALELRYQMSDGHLLMSRTEYSRGSYSTGASRALALREGASSTADPVDVNQLGTFVLYSSRQAPAPFQTAEGVFWKLKGGFQAVSVQRFGVSSAPLYARTRAEATPRIRSGHWLAGVDFAAGLDMQTSGGGDFPDSLYLVAQQVHDPALGDYFRQRIPVTTWEESRQDPWTRSHGFASGALSAAWVGDWFQLWLRGGSFVDLEGENGEDEPVGRFAEATLRYQFRSLDAAIGVWRDASDREAADTWVDPGQWSFGFRVGTVPF